MLAITIGCTAFLATLLIVSWVIQARTRAAVVDARAQLDAIARLDLVTPFRQDLSQLRMELGQRLDGASQQYLNDLMAITEHWRASALEERHESQHSLDALHRKMEWFRGELGTELKEFRAGIDGAFGQLRSELIQQLSGVRHDTSEQLSTSRKETLQALDLLREQDQAAKRESREAFEAALASFRQTIDGRMRELTERGQADSASLRSSVDHLVKQTGERIELLRQGIDQQLDKLRESNDARLEEMRRTVSEKLEGTLEKRLGESFRFVSERLEQVHKGLGEMQNLASGVGDLKRVLTNVKTRGTWGEVQLGALLDHILSPGQYEANVATRPGSGARVEYAICLPGQDERTIYLPIDAKFPQEDYLKLIEAQERADLEAADMAARDLERQVRACAREIAEKYIAPPHTTDYAILFLATEGLYAELMRRPGLVESLQREHRIMLAGPSTLAALLNSLQLGFRTLAIEKRSREVWSVLGAVKAEFDKFGSVLDKVRKKLDEATNVIEAANRRKRAVQRKLRDVQELPAHEAQALLGVGDSDDIDPNAPEQSNPLPSAVELELPNA